MQATATTLENTQETAPVNSRNKVVVASLIGTAIEFFDFYIYATAAVIVFPHIFFPQGDAAAANIDVTNGVARPQIFAFDTENALINVTGTGSFASEQLDLTIDPESKGFRVITLRSPLYVRGTFKSPQAGVKAGPLIVRGAVAAALATLVTPAAALLALISPAEGDSNQCRTILSQMKK